MEHTFEHLFLRTWNLHFMVERHATQNVMACVDLDLWFAYVLAGWEGIAHDALVLWDALECEDGLHVPQGNR
jgi:hypothetical protein